MIDAARVGTIIWPAIVPSAAVTIGATCGAVTPPTVVVTGKPAIFEKPLPVILKTVPDAPDVGEMVTEAPTVNVAVAVLGAGKDWSAALTVYVP